ncbi:choline kinase family protein [Microbulbifer sp. M83]|uniref:choline kinase family protein n=1 Tax=Microbulbifer sp. M83 TaxID=3118246 RepID=UPI002FE1E00B
MTESTGPLADVIPADWARWSSVPPRVIRPLAGGLTNRSYLLAAGNDRLVLRKNSPISDALDLDRQAEAAAMGNADRAGLCAPLVHCDPGHRYMVTRFVEGQPWRRDSNGALQQLADLLRGIHQLPTIDATLDIEEKVASYWQSIDPQAGFYPDLRTLDAEMHRHIEAVRPLADDLRLCHNDLSTANLITEPGGRLYAIDWEYAAMGDPFYDLAVIVDEHSLDDAQQHRLIEAYLERPLKSLDLKKLAHWRVIYGYLAVLWYAVQACAEGGIDSGTNSAVASRARKLSALSNIVWSNNSIPGDQ